MPSDKLDEIEQEAREEAEVNGWMTPDSVLVLVAEVRRLRGALRGIADSRPTGYGELVYFARKALEGK